MEISRFCSYFSYVVCFCGVFFFSCNNFAVSQPVISTCVIDSELFPLWRKPGEETMDSPGLNIELFNVISNRLSLKVEWVRAPFPRCLILLQNGEVDLINAVSYQKAREKYGKYPFTEGEIDISKRLKYDTYHAFVNSTDQVQWKKGKFVELGKMPVAIETGASVKNLLNRLNIDVLELPNAEHAFGMLLKKRVSAVITNVNNGYKYAHPSIKRLAEPVQNKAYYLMISNQFYQTHTELAEKIWLGSQSLHISTYQAVEDKYNKATPW